MYGMYYIHIYKYNILSLCRYVRLDKKIWCSKIVTKKKIYFDMNISSIICCNIALLRANIAVFFKDISFNLNEKKTFEMAPN